MTLAFSTQLNGKPTYFPEKILLGIDKYIGTFDTDKYRKVLLKKRDRNALEVFINSKIHTIRTDEKERWKAGNLIHFVINNRTPNRYQFAPVLKCIYAQKIVIKYFYNKKTDSFGTPMITIDGRFITTKEVKELAINDGFESTKDFFAYFNTDFRGKLIHWTNKKY